MDLIKTQGFERPALYLQEQASMLVRFLLLLVLMLLQGPASYTLQAEQYYVSIHLADSTCAISVKQQTVFAERATAIGFIQKIPAELYQQGFLAASVDSIAIHETQYEVYLSTGRKYKWGRLLFDSIPAPLLIAAAVSPPAWSGRPLNPKEITRVIERLLRYCDENGYPFARVWLGNITTQDATAISAMLMIDKGERRLIDSLIITGQVSISKNYLMRYLDISEGSMYNEKKLKMISQRIHDLLFLQEYAPWSMQFKSGATRLNLLLKEKRANQLNAIAGLLPNSQETGKLLFTADVQLALRNVLAHGETISVIYQNLQYKSPKIKADVNWPYLFNTPIGIDAHFDFFRNNLSFRRTVFQSGLRYQLNAADYLKVFYQVQSNRLISIDTSAILATRRLPANIDASANGAGMEFLCNRTDDRICPRKGWQIRMSTTALKRTIKRNAAISGMNDGTGFNFNTLYDTLTKASYQYHVVLEAAQYFRLADQLILKIAYSGGYIGSQRIFQNELFQLGGFKMLRGFDEQSIYANQYHMGVVECRLMLARNSYSYLFSDNAYVQTRFSNYYHEGVYNGLGMGTALETRSGLFSIAYALGRSDQRPVRFRESKILLGYTAYY